MVERVNAKELSVASTKTQHIYDPLSLNQHLSIWSQPLHLNKTFFFLLRNVKHRQKYNVQEQ